jgi:hypothetical protein
MIVIATVNIGLLSLVERRNVLPAESAHPGGIHGKNGNFGDRPQQVFRCLGAARDGFS